MGNNLGSIMRCVFYVLTAQKIIYYNLVQDS